MAPPSSSTPKAGKPATLAEQLFISGTSVATATMFTNPIDVVKTRLQLRNNVAGVRNPSMLAIGTSMVREEGVSALFKGLGPAVARGVVYGGLRLGLYQPIKEAMATAYTMVPPLPVTAKASTGMAEVSCASSAVGNSFGMKVVAGSTAGGLAAAISNPTELVKTRLQAHDNPHKGSMAVVRHILSTEGLAGLWKGAMPGLARAAVLTASQVATYDEVKNTVVQLTGWSGSNVATHFVSASVAGLVATTITNPLDVIKVVMFVSGNKYNGPVAATRDLWATEGVRGFLKGWTANFARLGPQTVVIFLVNEKLREVMGVQQLGG